MDRRHRLRYLPFLEARYGIEADSGRPSLRLLSRICSWMAWRSSIVPTSATSTAPIGPQANHPTPLALRMKESMPSQPEITSTEPEGHQAGARLNRPLHVALISRYPPRGVHHAGRGIAAYTKSLAAALVAQGLKGTVIAPIDDPSTDPTADSEEGGDAVCPRRRAQRPYPAIRGACRPGRRAARH